MWTLRIAMCISAIYNGLVQGKSTRTQLFSYEICGFPVDFPLNQSIDIYIYIHNIYIHIQYIYIYTVHIPMHMQMLYDKMIHKMYPHVQGATHISVKS